jgi:hypothetical protein
VLANRFLFFEDLRLMRMLLPNVVLDITTAVPLIAIPSGRVGKMTSTTVTSTKPMPTSNMNGRGRRWMLALRLLLGFRWLSSMTTS